MAKEKKTVGSVVKNHIKILNNDPYITNNDRINFLEAGIKKSIEEIMKMKGSEKKKIKINKALQKKLKKQKKLWSS